MSKSVNLYLASGVSDDIGFWIVNFTEKDNIINSFESKLLECYRKEIFGLDAAIEVKKAIYTTLDILVLESKNDGYELNDSTLGYSSEIPLNIIEEIFDLWAYNYNNQILWKKYIGLLQFRKKLKQRNNFISRGLKGNSYRFAIKLEELLSYRPFTSLKKVNAINNLMW